MFKRAEGKEQSTDNSIFICVLRDDLLSDRDSKYNV